MWSPKDASATYGDTGNHRRPDFYSNLFSAGEKVLAYHGPGTYVAQVQKAEIQKNEWKYFVNYLGWNWGEWVGVDRLMKYTKENKAWRKQIEGLQGVQGSIKIAALDEFYSFKMMSKESLLSAYSRFSFTLHNLNRTGVEKSKFEINITFLNGLSDIWILVKMIVRVSENFKNYTLLELYGQIQIHESTVMQEMTEEAECSDYNFRKEYTPQQLNGESSGNYSSGSGYERKHGHVKEKKSGEFVIICKNCKQPNHFAKDCKAKKVVKDVVYYMQKLKLAEEREKALAVKPV